MTARFNRPDAGLDLSGDGKIQLQSMMLYLAAVDQLRMQPDKQHERLSGRDENEAYLAFEQGNQYAVCFPRGGAVDLDIPAGKMSAIDYNGWISDLLSGLMKVFWEPVVIFCWKHPDQVIGWHTY